MGKKIKKRPTPTEKGLNVISMQDNQTDPQGSWTGIAENPYEKPVQDADDL